MITKENKEIYGVIYLIRNNINNKVYIGQTTLKGGFDRRYKGNIAKNTHNEHLRNAIENYGIENFYVDKEFDVAYSQEELNVLEDMYIKIYNSTNRKFGYNKRFGGTNSKLSEESKEKMSQAWKNRTKEEIEIIKSNMSKNHANVKGENNPAFKGFAKYKCSYCGKEVVKIQSDFNKNCNDNYCNNICKAKHQKELLKGENNPFYGKKHSEEAKKKIGQANRGKLAGEKSPHAKKVICITTGEIFETITIGANKYNYSYSNISANCTGRTKSAGKHPITGERLVWKYYSDYLKEIEEKSLGGDSIAI